jgi:hypothetical protein
VLSQQRHLVLSLSDDESHQRHFDHTQVFNVYLDCDRDSIIYLSSPIGPSCHTGARNCWFQLVALSQTEDGSGSHVVATGEHSSTQAMPRTTLQALEHTIESRRLEAASKTGAITSPHPLLRAGDSYGINLRSPNEASALPIRCVDRAISLTIIQHVAPCPFYSCPSDVSVVLMNAVPTTRYRGVPALFHLRSG